MPVIGIDVGSLSSKGVLFDGQIKDWLIQPTGWSPKQAGGEVYRELLERNGFREAEITYVVGTGYGRISLDFIQKAVTEITCHAQGVHYLVPKGRTIIDIGGQDSKVININEQGKVLDFLMNDKCAAGTGRFLQVAANALGMEVEELSRVSPEAGLISISSMCTVFAESEIVSLLAQGEEKERIINGIHQAISRRIKGMLEKIGKEEKIVFTGGVAKNSALKLFLEKEIGKELFVPPDPQIMGALGAALLAYKEM